MGGAKVKDQKNNEENEAIDTKAQTLTSKGEGDIEKEHEPGYTADEDGAGDNDSANVDIFSLEDICNIGDGEPLFANFMFEDWALMSLRFELHLLVRTFKLDLNDPDRPGMHKNHLPFYFNKYYRKQLSTKFFGANTLTELINMVKDTVDISNVDGAIVPQLSKEN